MAAMGGPEGKPEMGGPEDKVVREIDIYFCTGQLQGTKVLLLQYPLRPPWQPYDSNGFSSVRVKPRALKVELDAPLNTRQQYNKDVEAERRIDQLTLTSCNVDTGTTFAVGSVRDNRLFLTPLDGALHMRPSLAYLDMAAAAAAAQEGAAAGGRAGGRASAKDDVKREEDSGQGPGLVPLTVQVRKRENERQVAARMSSYAYLQQQLDEEPWVQLQYVDMNNDAADEMWCQMMEPPSEEQPEGSTKRASYLDAIVPGLSGRAMADAAAQAAAIAEQAAAAQGRGGEALGSGMAPAKELSKAARDALPKAVATLYRHQHVCSLQDIRAFLERSPEEDGGPIKEWVAASDAQLGEALASMPTLVYLRRVYLQRALGNAALDPLRSLVLGLFQDKETLKRSEILSSAKAAGLSINDSLYNKVMRAMCESKGGQWSLKSGADLVG